MIDRNTRIKVAYWYYKKNMTQDAIAQRLGCSRQRVNKIVNSLVSDGIVSIVINGLDNEYILLENELEHLFSIKQVIIADTAQSELPGLSVLGKKAADFLDDYILDGKTIGVSWGLTLSETVQQMRSTNKSRCNVVQLVGGLNTSERHVKPDEIARMLAQKLDCSYNILYAPAIMSSEIAREIMAQQDIFKEAFERINACDIAVVGIGQLDPSGTIVSQGYIPEEVLQDMCAKGYVGDICFHHFKCNGDVGNYQLQNRVMGVDLSTLHKIPEVIAIAGGLEKAEAVCGALNTGCIDILITDIYLARRLKELAVYNKSNVYEG